MVVVLLSAGDHVPVMPFKEVVGNGARVVPEQIAATGLNVGVTTGSIVTDAVVVTPGQAPLAATVYVTV